MFNSDRPINSISQDLLHRTSFAKQLAGAILSYTSFDNFAISLCGEWGCGKTSIINMVLQEIEDETKDKDDTKPIIVEFNPWNYSDRNQLISQFFKTILTRLNCNNKDGKMKALGESMQKYADVFEYTSYIPVIGQYLSPIKKLIEGAGGHISDTVTSHQDIAYQKDEVIKALKSQAHKFIIVIDDIDRLNNEQIRLIFQLVNSLAGFPNMIYLLSFDKKVVVRALEEEQNCNGEEYLEKIIQVPFDVPRVNQTLLNKIFFDRLKNIFDENQDFEFKDSDRTYWTAVRDNCIIPFLNSVRDINRIINTYRFKYGLMKNETHWIDLLALTTLQISAPEIADWIYNNISYLTGSARNYRGTSLAEDKEIYNTYFEKFKEIYPSDPSKMMRIIQVLFPYFAQKTGSSYTTADTSDELRYSQRLSSKERYSSYFDLSLEEIKISKEDILQSIHSFNDVEFDEYTKELIEDDCIDEYLTELRGYVVDMEQEEILTLARKLFRLHTKLSQLDNKDNYLISPTVACYRCACLFLSHMTHDAVSRFLEEQIKSADTKSIGIIVDIIIDIEDDLGRIRGRDRSDKALVGQEQIGALEESVVAAFHKLSTTVNLMDLENFNNIAVLWRLIKYKDYIAFIKDKVKTKENIPKYLYIIAGHWTGGGDMGWTFMEKNYADIIGTEDAYKAIHSLKNTEEFRALSLKFQEICIAFCLWHDATSEDEKDRVSRSTVSKLLPRWL